MSEIEASPYNLASNVESYLINNLFDLLIEADPVLINDAYAKFDSVVPDLIEEWMLRESITNL